MASSSCGSGGHVSETTDDRITTLETRFDRHRDDMSVFARDIHSFIHEQFVDFDRRMMAGFRNVVEHLAGLDERLSAVEARTIGLERRFDTLEQRFDNLDQRFGTLEERLDSLDARFGTLEQRFDSLEETAGGLKQRVAGIERQLTGIREQMADNQRVLIAKLAVFVDSQTRVNREILSRLPPSPRGRKRGSTRRN